MQSYCAHSTTGWSTGTDWHLVSHLPLRFDGCALTRSQHVPEMLCWITHDVCLLSHTLQGMRTCLSGKSLLLQYLYSMHRPHLQETSHSDWTHLFIVSVMLRLHARARVKEHVR